VLPRFGMVDSDLFEGTGAVDSWYGDRSQSTLWQESVAVHCLVDNSRLIVRPRGLVL
jgi:hypothetical protein